MISGDFITETGCRVTVADHTDGIGRHTGKFLLLLRMVAPGDNRTAEVLLTEGERRQLMTALASL